jgi:fluoroquinolone transport system ATP-binding protein
VIHVEHLSFTYAGGSHPAVRDISFDIAPGEVFGFLGPSGSGKSTTQKVLIGLLDGYEGEVTVMGRDLRKRSADYYERVGISFEMPNHYLKLTAIENLRYFASMYSGETEDPRRLLEMVGLADDGDTRVGQFSKGMRARLNVARALLNRPTVLFLDEPTTGLDPVNARRIKDLVERKRAEGATVFLTTHNMWVADELCDRVAFLVDGRIELVGSPRDLRLQHGRRSVVVETAAPGGRAAREFPLDDLGANADFLSLIRESSIETIHTQETTLENIFIAVTGRELG